MSNNKTIRAKFNVVECTRYFNGGGAKVKLMPCTSNAPENKSFNEATPYGTIEMGVTVPEVIEQFEKGGEYYIDFTKVE